MPRLIMFTLVTLMAAFSFSAAAEDKVKRTADDIKVPERSEYRDRNKGMGYNSDGPEYDENGWDYRFFPPDSPMNRSEMMLKKVKAHYADGLAAQKKECSTPWPPIITAIRAIRDDQLMDINITEKLIKKYEALKKKQKAQLKKLEAEVKDFSSGDKIRPVTVGSYNDLNANQKKYWDYTKLKAKVHELGLWVTGMKEINGYRQKALKEINAILAKAKAQSKAWKKPKHCPDHGMSKKYKYTSTKCKKCESAVRQYNTFIDSMNSLQYDIDKYERKQKNGQYVKELNETPGNVKFWLSELYDQLNNLKIEINDLAKEIKRCEKKCAPVEEEKKDIKIGSAAGSAKHQYISTTCDKCKALVAQHNHRIDSMNELEHEIAEMEKKATEYPALYKDKLKKLRDELENFTLRTQNAKRELAQCEKQCKIKKKPIIEEPKKEIKKGDDFEIELEDARGVDGTDAFDSKEVEKVGGGHPPREPIKAPPPPIKTGGGSVPPKPPVPPVQDKPKEEISVGGGQPPIQEPPKEPFSAYIITGNTTMTHVIGEDSCPDPVIKTTIKSSDRRAMKAQMASNHKVLSVSVSGGSNGEVGLDVKFNCNVAGPGTYRETVDIKVTDPDTGQSQTVHHFVVVIVEED